MITKKHKKGYFYTIDAVIGVIILMIGLLFVFGFYFYSPDKERTQGISIDVTGLLTNVRTGDLCDNLVSCSCEYNSLERICNDNLLTNPNMNMMEVFGLLYYNNNRTAIEEIVQEILIDDKIVPENFQMQIILEDPGNDRLEQLYPLIEI